MASRKSKHGEHGDTESHGGESRLKEEILEMLQERGAGKTICPSEVARGVVGSEDRAAWESLMQPVRDAAQALVADGKLLITQRGRVVDGATAKGPIRLRLR